MHTILFYKIINKLRIEKNVKKKNDSDYDDLVL